MSETILYRNSGFRADVGHLPVMRLLPNEKARSIGPFVFLDHILPSNLKPSPKGMGAHPHRGIATFTYLLKGTLEHYDSSGNHGIVGSGGIQWMKAGNGVIHEENVPENLKEGVSVHGMQFWINLPSINKKESPKYIPLLLEEIPEIDLGVNIGSIKILLGQFQGQSSKIDVYSDQFMYHLKLNQRGKFEINLNSSREHGIFLPNGEALINGERLYSGQLSILTQNTTSVIFKNDTDLQIDIIFFGGLPYIEPMISHGPFIMSTVEEINAAYDDYESGKYGTIKYK